MLIFNRSFSHSFAQRHLYSVQASSNRVKDGKKFQQTVFLPKTDFPSHLNSDEVQERDQRIQKECEFLDFYNWQRKHLKGKEFILHDGPPYANGKPHIGHAINKILKDIVLRSQVLQGKRVHFVPGWDCHGLPIELVALKSMQSTSLSNAIEIRTKAKEVATIMSNIQKEAFKELGVMADWTHQCYYTFDVNYITNQLEIFWKLYEKGLIYYDLKPVFYSPSSRSALAESELVYKDHISRSVTLRLETVQNLMEESLYLLIWTTTPWTIPFNKAVTYCKKIKYSTIKIHNFPGLYIIATELIDDLKKKLQVDVTVNSDFPISILSNLSYKHPWNKDQVMKVYESQNVGLQGTGLIHIAPAHGHSDFAFAQANGLKVECFVDEKGCYMSSLGGILGGLNILEEGSKTVMENLSSDIVLAENYSHSYPYDWRTDKPVIIRASNQWFIDTNQLKEKAVESLETVPIPLEYFRQKLKDRPYWCLSRQRTWGVPIPVFFHKKSNRPLLSKNLINRIIQIFETHGPDAWWTANLEDLFPDEICRELFVSREDIVKGGDIMDIWFDSGTSWSYVLSGKQSDLYLEGQDQYAGWFQSSLLISTGAGNGVPFKQILTHGFAVDEHGKKMSKSLGNVLDPETVLHGKEALGVDALRWWVGCHAHHTAVPASMNILKTNSDSVQKFRHVFRYLLGALRGSTHEDLIKCNQLQTLDVYLLNSCYKFYNSVMDMYNKYDIYGVCAKILFFVPNEVSARYITCIKDRLYCDELDSTSRKACIYTINCILRTLTHIIAPILPHLVEEIYLHHPVYAGQKFFFVENPWSPPESWKNDSHDKVINLIHDIKNEILLIDKNTTKLKCVIEIEEEPFELLKGMQNGKEESISSELIDILGVSEVCLKLSNQRKVNLLPTKASSCARCRRYNVFENSELCVRCERIVSNMVSFKMNYLDTMKCIGN
ncbi:hypothetical protein RUM43_013735 [Polyplax serrata]|uniref:isoleucine--tRNA ligase n=1 Tax=Polyplax serrata TaxID=468196 RepID=A0AAN8P4D3_POLSC